MPTSTNCDATPTGGSPADTTTAGPPHYRRPDWFTRRVMVPVFNLLMRLGISVWGSRTLEHRGRVSGTPHRTPVNLLTLDGAEYLVAPRGETQWVRNVRADGGRMALRLGRHSRDCIATEVPVDQRAPVLRAYLARWKFEVGMFFDGVGPASTDDELTRIAVDHPVFVLHD